MDKKCTPKALISNLPQDITELQEIDQELPNLLHELCFRIEEFSHEDRMMILQYLGNANFLPCEQRIRCIWNMLYAYFVCMTENEKIAYLKILLGLGSMTDNQKWGGIFELVGVLMKDAPSFMQESLFNLVASNFSKDMLQDPSLVISLCNCFRWGFWETSTNNRNRMIQILDTIGAEQQDSVYIGSVIFTLERLKEQNLL